MTDTIKVNSLEELDELEIWNMIDDETMVSVTIASDSETETEK